MPNLVLAQRISSPTTNRLRTPAAEMAIAGGRSRNGGDAVAFLVELRQSVDFLPMKWQFVAAWNL
jgi:hypothetical protein